MRLLVALLALASCCAAVPALAASGLSGTLWLSASARGRAGTSEKARTQRGVTEGVVWVEKIPAAVQAKLGSPRRGWLGLWHAPEPPLPNVEQVRETFAPRILVVPAGSQVEFSNSDRLYHALFSVSGAKRFDLGRTSPGHHDTLAFERPGVINLHCEIHPQAVGYLVVTPNRAFASPDSTGRFQLPKLPPGRYVLHAWHPDKGELELPFVVPRRGSVALDPTF